MPYVKPQYRMGDHYVIDDRTGWKRLASQCRMQWNGLLVHHAQWEERHPQDYIRSLGPDQQTARPTRSPGIVDEFIGPLTTTMAAAAAAGDDTLTVSSSVRMAVNDHVSICLDNGAVHVTTIYAVPSSSTISIDDPLPGAVSSGNVVTDNTAMSVPSY